ncbi:MAG: hypothetical protein P8J14_08250, partial [Emcibacteraceae bacterium]|nr:hypothetical protein [Emcibacteraceae bacterium]
MERRDFIAKGLKGAAVLPLMATLPISAFAQNSDPDFTPALVGKPWDPARNAMVFDAMGEIRDTFTDELIE